MFDHAKRDSEWRTQNPQGPGSYDPKVPEKKICWSFGKEQKCKYSKNLNPGPGQYKAVDFPHDHPGYVLSTMQFK